MHTTRFVCLASQPFRIQTIVRTFVRKLHCVSKPRDLRLGVGGDFTLEQNFLSAIELLDRRLLLKNWAPGKHIHFTIIHLLHIWNKTLKTQKTAVKRFSCFISVYFSFISVLRAQLERGSWQEQLTRRTGRVKMLDVICRDQYVL